MKGLVIKVSFLGRSVTFQHFVWGISFSVARGTSALGSKLGNKMIKTFDLDSQSLLQKPFEVGNTHVYG